MPTTQFKTNVAEIVKSCDVRCKDMQSFTNGLKWLTTWIDTFSKTQHFARFFMLSFVLAVLIQPFISPSLNYRTGVAKVTTKQVEVVAQPACQQ